MGITHIDLQIILCPFITWVNPFGMPYTFLGFPCRRCRRIAHLESLMRVRRKGAVREDSSGMVTIGSRGWYTIVDKVWLTGLPTMEYPMIYPYIYPIGRWTVDT